MNNNLISREALKKSLEEYKYCGFYDKLIEIIDNAPTVDLGQMRQEATENALKKAAVLYGRVQGEWNYIQAGMCVCPFCGAMPHKLYKNFCAKCGAKMKGGAK